MTRALLLIALVCCSASAQAGDFWDSLWRNPDQRGERLLHKGEVQAAAKTYHDPRRKAYAELQSGDYENAAKHLSPYDDADSHYNRGNALAQAGKLQEALQAYDAALAKQPNDKDARHNRDLVAQALQQQAPQQASKSQPDSSEKSSSAQDGKHEDKQSGGGDNKNQQDDQQAGSKQDDKQQSASGASSSEQNQNSKAQPGQSAANQQQGDAAKQSDTQGQSAQAAASNKQANTADPSKQRTPADDAALAKQDAAAALGKPQKVEAGMPSDSPISEQQLAQEQWLRAIPDDPGGLLRRKFMIEHMIRQQGGRQ